MDVRLSRSKLRRFFLFELLVKSVKKSLYILVGWGVVLPIAEFIKCFTKKKYLVFIGRDAGLFLDNIKYFFIYCLRQKDRLEEIELMFLTEDQETYRLLKNKQLPVVKYPSWSAMKILVMAKLIIVDNWMWVDRFKFFLLFSTRKLQLWHGLCIKYVGLIRRKFKRLFIKILDELTGIYPKYAVFVSTSSFYTKQVFSKAFRTGNIWETGLPRNDIFFRELSDEDFIFTDTNSLEFISYKKENGLKIALYAPTFRDTKRNVFNDGVLDLGKLDSFLQEVGILLVIKFHPEENFDEQILGKYKNICAYKRDKDIYPLLRMVDCLITDYSSIYMDFLLLDRPIIFFCYDFEQYIANDRMIQFDYDWITPGIKVRTQNELEKALKEILVLNEDEYKDHRRRIRDLAFKYIDGYASKRVFDNMMSDLL